VVAIRSTVILPGQLHALQAERLAGFRKHPEECGSNGLQPIATDQASLFDFSADTAESAPGTV
jgi:hypothetical protein